RFTLLVVILQPLVTRAGGVLRARQEYGAGRPAASRERWLLAYLSYPCEAYHDRGMPASLPPSASPQARCLASRDYHGKLALGARRAASLTRPDQEGLHEADRVDGRALGGAGRARPCAVRDGHGAGHGQGWHRRRGARRDGDAGIAGDGDHGDEG